MSRSGSSPAHAPLRGSGARPDWIGRAVLALLVLLLFREALAGGVFYKRDIHLIWHPAVEGFVRAVAGGSLPLWDPSPAFGQPLLADPASQVLYPLTWLNLLMRPWAYYTLFALGHVLFSALAFHALARRWGISPLAATTGAAAWMLAGPFLSLVDLWHHFASASYLPAVLLACERAAERRRARDVLVLGSVLGLQILAGSADYCALTLATASAFLVLVHADRRDLRDLPRLAAGGAAALLVALALSAGLWVSALDTAWRSARRELPEAVRTYWSVHPASLGETLLAGVPGRLPLAIPARAAVSEGREPFLGSLYLGLPGLALVGAALAGGTGRRRWALAVIGLAAVLVALGRHAPFYSLAVALAPPLRLLRYPVKAMPVAAFAWACLVAYGVDAWRAAPRRFAWLALVVAPVALASLLAGSLAAAVFADAAWLQAAGILAPGSRPELVGLARGLAIHGGLGALVAALALARAPRSLQATAWAAAAALVLDLAVAHPRPNPVAPRALYTLRPEALASLRDPAGARLYSYDYGFTQGRPAAAAEEVRNALGLERMPLGWTPDAASALAMQWRLAPQTAGRWGLRQAYDVDYRGLQPAPLARLTQAVRVLEERPGAVLCLLRLGAVTHVTAFHAVARELRRVAELKGLYARPLQVFEVPGTLPRARIVSGVRVVADGDALGTLLDPAHDPARSVVLAEGRQLEPTPGFGGSAAIVAETADTVRIEAALGSEGYLVLADTYDPGWRVRVDGREADLLRADTCFRAVALPAGRHSVEMRYRPRGVLAALLASSLALLGVLAGLFRLRPAP